MDQAVTSSAKKVKFNEAGDPMFRPQTLTSHNDGLIEVAEMFDDLSFTDHSSSMNWRKRVPIVPVSRSTFPLSFGQNTVPKMGPTAAPAAAGNGKKPFILSGPNEAEIENLMARRPNYELERSARQRKYTRKPGTWNLPAVTDYCQVFVGKIPKQLFEDTLVPLFEKAGTIYEFRLMMEGAPSVISRGHAFVMFATPDEAKRAADKLNNFEIIPGYHIVVAVSPPVCRLFIAQIPKHLTVKQVEDELYLKFKDVTSVDYKPVKGFGFVTFKDHVTAASAKKLISNGSVRLFSGLRTKVIVDFADQIPEPEEREMAGIRNVFVTGFQPWISETKLAEIFKDCGVIEKVRKVKDYAFVDFKERSSALTAIEKFDKQMVFGSMMHVSLAKPPVDVSIKDEAMTRRAKRLENQKKHQRNHSLSQSLSPTLYPSSLIKDLHRDALVLNNAVLNLDNYRFVLVPKDTPLTKPMSFPFTR